jgi:hypothetical protein
MMMHGWGWQAEQNLPIDLIPVSVLTMHELSSSMRGSNAQSELK